jgi:beta-lactamase regulating signal transducer with metallopeptidase domain
LLWVTTLALSILLPLWTLESSSSIGWLWASPASRGDRGKAIYPTPASSSTSAWLVDFFSERTQSISFAPSVTTVLAACYLLFLLYRAIRLTRAWQETKQISRNARASGVPDSIITIAEQCRAAFGLKAIPILCSQGIEAPLTIGATRQVIILPECLLRTDSPELISTAIGHEMAHIRRGDFFWNFIYELIYLPLSFHPAALLVKRRIRETRELACDEMVTERLMNPGVYARSLVRIASSIKAIDRPTYSLGIFDANNLEERIMKLMEKRPRASALSAKILFIITIFAISASALAASAFSLSIGQDKGAESAAALKNITGKWTLYPRTDGQADDSKGLTIILELTGNKLSGRTLISMELQDAQGNMVKKNAEWQLINPQFDGTNFSFKVIPSDKDGSGNASVIEGKMKLVGGDFVGRWTSEDQAGDLKMIRKKE